MLLTALLLGAALLRHPTDDYRMRFPLPSARMFDGLGVNVNGVEYTGPDDLKMISAIGGKFVRADFQWTDIERVRGEYDFALYDRFVDEAAAAGLRCYLAFDYDNPLYAPSMMAGPKTDDQRRAFASFVDASVRHFKGRGIVWEIWNEPNFDHFWQPKANVDDYVALAKAAGQALRDAGPDEWLVLPASSGFDWKFLEGCFRGGLLDLADGVSVHPYRAGRPETVGADWKRLRTLIDRYASPGRKIDMLCGEWGYADTEVGAAGMATDYAADSTRNLLQVSDPTQMNPYWLKPTISGGQPDPLGGTDACRFESADKPDDPGRFTSGVWAPGHLSGGRTYTVSAYLRTDSGEMNLRLGLADGNTGTVHITDRWQRKSVTIRVGGPLDRVFQVYETTPNNPAWYMAFPQVEETSAATTLQAARKAHGQAIVDLYKANLAAGVGMTILYDLRDLGRDPSNREDHFGLLDFDGNPKPAYERLKQEYEKSVGH